MSVRTLFIGMDGATFTVLDDLTKANGSEPVMPFLARICTSSTASPTPRRVMCRVW